MKAKKLLTLALGAALAVSLTVPAMAAEKTFPDVPGTWAEKSIGRWADAGVLEGDNSGEYKPGKSMTRAEFAAMLCKLMGYTEMAENTYGDVAPTAWYHDAILKVTAAGVMKGDGKNANPDAPVSREEAAVMLCRAMNIKSESKTVTKFDDSAAVASWAQEAVAALSERGMINGVGGNMFAPANSIDRASAAHLLDNMIHTYITVPGEYTVDDADAIVIVNAKPVDDKAAQAVTVTGKADTVVVAPGTAAAVTAEKLTAANVTVASEADVTVDKDSKVADLTVAAPADVTVAGQADSVTLESGALTVAQGGKVDAVAVPETAADDVALTVDKGAEVGAVTADAPVAVDNSGTVAKVEANADGVTIDGNAPQKIDTAEGVTAPTDSKGETVTEKPAPSGGSSSGGSSGGSTTPTTPTEKTYTVTLSAATNGTLTSDSALTGLKKDDKVTVKATPADGYALKTLTVDGTDVELTTYNGGEFTHEITIGEKNVTVSATFETPLKHFEVVIINDKASYNKLPEAFRKWDSGITEEKPEGDKKIDEPWGNISTAPWIAVIAEKADATLANGGTITITNGSTNVTTPSGWSTAVGEKGACTAYVGTTPSEDPKGENADQLKISTTPADIKVTLVYEKATFTGTVTYKAPGEKVATAIFKDGETEIDRKTVKIENGSATITAPAAPTKDGYTFKGWKPETGDTVNAGASITVTAEGTVTYTAVWEVEKHTVTFNNKDKDTDPTTTTAEVEHGKTATKPTDPTREGYTFSGWYTDANCTTEFNFGTHITADITLYAKWEAKTYTVKFNVNGGKGTIADVTAQYDTTITEPTEKPTKDNGYTFGGWYKDADCQNAWTFNSDKVTADTTLYAKWTPIEYTVIFGEANSTDTESWTVEGKVGGSEKELSLTKRDDMKAPAGYVYDCDLPWYYLKDGTTATKLGDTVKIETIKAAELYNYAYLDGTDWKISLCPAKRMFATIAIPDSTAIGNVFTGDWAKGINANNMIVTLAGDEDSDNVLNATGAITAYKWEGFDPAYKENDRWYIVFTIEKPEGMEQLQDDPIVVRAGTDENADAYKIKLSDFTDENKTKIYVAMLVGDATKEPVEKATEVTIVVNWNGVTDGNDDVHYTIKLDGTGLEWKTAPAEGGSGSGGDSTEG